MGRLIEFPLEDGGHILVEVETVISGQGISPASRPSEIIEKANKSFEAAIATVKPIATAIIGKIRELQDPPDETEVEFGLKLSAEAGAVLASAGVEANYKVTLTWKRTEKKNE